MRIALEMFGDTILKRDLLRVEGRAIDGAPAFEAIIEHMKDDLGEQFGSEGEAMSGGWEALKPATIAQKARLDQRPEILRATDRMMNSLLDETEDSVKVVTPWGMDWGTKVPYSIVHQKGSLVNNIPARPIIDFTEAQKQKYVKILQRYVMTGEVA